jgi:tetratricopeptide (TPR) repeat protein
MNEVGTPDRPRRELNPYVGPRPFRQAEAGRFFGRNREARDVRSLWLGDRVVVLHGPEAVGKTSLLSAGVLPLLSSETDVDVLPVGRLGHQSARPLASAPEHNGFSFALLSSWAQFRQPSAPGTSIADFLSSRPQRMTEGGELHSVLAAIDQFEELFTEFPGRQREREAFLDELSAALERVPALKLLLVVRDDHLATLRSYERRLSPHGIGYVRLEALSPAAASEAVIRPLEATGRSFADGVVHDLVDQLRTVVYTDLVGESVTLQQERVDPLLLQIVCTQLWSALPASVGVIGPGDLHIFGGIEQALTRFYEDTIRTVGLETGEPQDRLRAWVESVFISQNGTRGTAYRGAITTADMPNLVVDAFTDRHLLAAEQRARGTWYQLGQDRLISAIRQANRAWRTTYRQDSSELSGTYPAPVAFVAAEAALIAGNYPSAHRLAQVAANRYRESGDERRLAHALVLAGDISRAEGDFGAAEENLEAALSRSTILEDRNVTVRTLSALGDIRFSLGDYTTAAEFHREAVERLPTDIEALIGLGYAQWYGGLVADSEATFTRALRGSGKAARAFGGRGQVRAEMRQYGDALADLDDALASSPSPGEEIDIRSARALALAGLGRHEEADAELAIARAQDPDRARTLLRAALIAATRGERELERDQLERAVRAQPPLPPSAAAEARRLLAALGP